MLALTALDNTKTQQAIKTALAAVLATWITQYFHMPHPFWAPAIVIMLMDDHLEGSIKKGIARIMGTIVGAGLAYFIGHFTLDSQPLFYLCTFLILSITIYGFLLGSSSWLVFGVTYLFLSMYMVMDPDGSLTIAAWRSSEMITGVASWVLVSLLVFPSNLTRDIALSIQTIVKDSQILVHNIHQSIREQQTINWEDDKAAFKKTLEQLTTYQSLLGSTGKQGQMQNDLAILIEHGWTWWRQCGQLYQGLQKEPDLNTQLDAFFASVDDLLTQWYTCLTTNTALSPDLNQFIAGIEATMSTVLEANNATNNHAHYTLLQTWLDALQNWLTALSQFINEESLISKPKQSVSFKHRWHALWIKVASKRSLLPHCLSIGLGCCLVIYVWLLTGWPGGVCAGISALVVGADSNLTKINLKIRLRLLGSLVGAAAGLVIYIFFVHNIIAMLCWVFIGVGVLAYLSQINFQSMYFCWMASMGYVITLVPSLQLTPSLDFTFERIFGLIMGLVVMGFVVNFFWPLNPKKQLQEIFHTIYSKIAISWQLLSETNTDNLEEQRTQLHALQTQMMALIADGTGIAKPNGMMKAIKPVTNTILAQQWCSNYLTQDCLNALESLAPKQWQALCLQTKTSITSKQASDIAAAQEGWQQLITTLQSTTSIDATTIGQCWLSLQANERLLDTLKQ